MPYLPWATFSAREIIFATNPYGILVLTEYRIDGSGDIHVTVTFQIHPTLKDLPRVGVELVLPEGFEALEYWGLGPVENYRDRKHAATLGVYKSSVEKEHFAYIPPSETGGHEETRWVAITNEEGRTFKVSSLTPFHFDVHHNTIEDYKRVKHEHELIRRKESYLHIDAAHSGIGSDMGWSTFLPEQERVKAQSYSLSFIISQV